MKQKMQNIKITSCLFVNVLFIFLGCNNNNNKSPSRTHKEYYPNGKLKLSAEYFNNKRNGLTIFYYENGNIESLENYINDTIDGEVFSFYPNGYLERKSVINMGIPNGPNYAFYSNGLIKEYRKWINGKKEGYGVDYWKKDGDIKAIYFSRHDTLVYRRLLDTLGYVIKTEGTPPALP